MSEWMIAAALFSMVLAAGICVGLSYYIYRSVRRRSAIGLGWDFDRDTQPVLFWLQLGLVAMFVVSELVRLFGGLAAMARLLF